jgi:hypothetical protein
VSEKKSAANGLTPEQRAVGDAIAAHFGLVEVDPDTWEPLAKPSPDITNDAELRAIFSNLVARGVTPEQAEAGVARAQAAIRGRR